MGVEEIITFLVFVFYIVRTIMAQKNKAEKQRKRGESTQPIGESNPEPVEPRRRPRDVFESENPEIDILEELFGKKEEKVAPSSPKAQPIIAEQVKSLKDIELTEQRMADKMKLDYEKDMEEFRLQIAKSFARKQIHNKRRRGKYANRYIKEFDLKKAVIYSEILKRPYE
ncbi:MAG: hypothetical protein HKO56_00205 [Bacteroidia bacterium]|nr:hypothetical protein [Bacteroidia bacterium]NNC85836.1 hypothetical protein [Bacteroidia bacterium]NNM15045.1 hypothetical protein [Bacteroidia bacterium]